MQSLRPKRSALYLERPRLLQRLPDSPGYTVWLEAPYGYGKSVLASQWADVLEAAGWRVLWLTLREQEVKGVLAAAQQLPATAPWGVMLDALWREKTLLVLEDLGGQEEMSELLKDVRGLLLLASRQALPYPELPRLLTQGRLLHLKAEQLAFTRNEAVGLVGNSTRAEVLWRETGGWALPLHFAALTGDVPQHDALFAGMRASLSEESWQELLFLSCLPYLPQEAAREVTAALARAGFVQRLEEGYRLHPLLASSMKQAFRAEVQFTVRENLTRLPPLLQGTALEALSLYAELADLLNGSKEDLAKHDPHAVLRWDALAPGPRGITRSIQVGWSRWATGRHDAGISLLQHAAATPAMPADEKLLLYKNMLWVLCERGLLDQAEELASLGEASIEAASADVAGRFLHNTFFIHFRRGDWAKAREALERALATYPPESPFRAITLGNLAIVRWHQEGDFELLLSERGNMLATNRKLNPSNVPGDLLQLAELKGLLNERKLALGHISELAQWAHANPRWALEAEALQRYLEGNIAAFPSLYAKAQLWENPELEDRVIFFWARTCRETGQPPPPVLKESHGAWSRLESALVALETGDDERALSLLGEVPPVTAPMEKRLYWQAAHYLVTGELTSLEALCGLTLAGERVLPALVPLERLPRNTPAKAKAYPMGQVLESDWREAILCCLDDIPPLELDVLGHFEAKVLGKSVTLAERQKEILTLLLLGCSRDEIGAAIWPEASKDKVRNNLHVQLNLLRKRLEPWGVSTYLSEEGLRRTRADFWDLQDALKAADPGSVARLYREPLAPGVDLEIVSEAREALRQAVINVFFMAAQHVEDSDGILQQLLTLEPLHEEALQLSLKRLMRRGRRVEAHQRYQSFATRLKQELGLEPLVETRALLEP